MTETLPSMADEVDPQHLAEQLLAQAKAQGVDLVGPDGLLNRLTKNVLETALEAEMSEHLPSSPALLRRASSMPPARAGPGWPRAPRSTRPWREPCTPTPRR